FPAPRTSSAGFYDVSVAAAAPGHGLTWRAISPDATNPQVDLRLLPEQVVRGRLVDLQGLPAAGVRVPVRSVGEYVNALMRMLSRDGVARRLPASPQETTTDADGRFVVRGCHRDGGIWLNVQDDRFGGQGIQLTTPGKPRAERTTYGIDAGGYLMTARTGP